METAVEPGDMFDHFEPRLLKSPAELPPAKDPHRSDEYPVLSPYWDSDIEPRRHEPGDIDVDLRSLVLHRLRRAHTSSQPPRSTNKRARSDRQLAASSP